MKATLLLIVLFLAGCGGKTRQQAESVTAEAKDEVRYPVTIPFEEGMADRRDAVLSQFASEVVYVPLETNAQSLIQNVKGCIEVTREYIYLPCMRNLFQFTGEGKFVRQIGKTGQGPGEYNYIRHIATDEMADRLYLLTTGKVVVYTLEGKYEREIRLKNRDPWQFALINDSLMAAYSYNSNGQVKDKIVRFNMNGDSISSIPQYDQFKLQSTGSYMLAGPADRYFATYEGETSFKEYYCDTLFTITPGDPVPRYILRQGKYTLPVEKRFERMEGNRQRYFEESAPYLRTDIIETNKYIFLPSESWGNVKKSEQLVIYDKSTQTCFSTPDGTIRNDLGGSSTFRPFTNIGDNTLLEVREASDIIDEMDKNPSLKEHPILKNIKEDDNPVLIIVKLK